MSISDPVNTVRRAGKGFIEDVLSLPGEGLGDRGKGQLMWKLGGHVVILSDEDQLERPPLYCSVLGWDLIATPLWIQLKVDEIPRTG